MTLGGLSIGMLIILPLTMVTLACVFMFIFRELFNWYWKQNEIIATLQKINGTLENIALNQQVEPINRQPSAGRNPAHKPKRVIRKSRAEIEERKYGPPKKKSPRTKSIRIQ